MSSTVVGTAIAGNKNPGKGVFDKCIYIRKWRSIYLFFRTKELLPTKILNVFRCQQTVLKICSLSFIYIEKCPVSGMF